MEFQPATQHEEFLLQWLLTRAGRTAPLRPRPPDPGHTAESELEIKNGSKGASSCRANVPPPPVIPPSASPSLRPTPWMTSSPSCFSRLLQLIFFTPPLLPHRSLSSLLAESLKRAVASMKSTNQHPWEPSGPLLHHVSATSRGGGWMWICGS